MCPFMKKLSLNDKYKFCTQNHLLLIACLSSYGWQGVRNVNEKGNSSKHFLA